MKTTNSSSSHSKWNSRVTITVILGIVLAIAGMHHGFFEILQGSTPTNTLFIEAIGKSHQMWPHGNDGAFTVIPNFLITGIASVLISILIILWSVFFLSKKQGVTVFLLLFIALTLTGGGIGHIPFFILIWAYATGIHSSMDGWKKYIPEKLRPFLSKTWLYATILTGVLFLTGMEISVFGYVPGVSDPDTVLIVNWSVLFTALLLINYSYVAAIANDLQYKKPV